MVLVLGVAVSTSGCGSGPGSIERDASARAFLDPTTGEIVMPLSEYDLFDSQATIELFNHTLDLSMSECMAAAGFSFSGAHVDEDPASSPGDRTYGLWNLSSARRHGFAVAPSTKQQALEADLAAGGEAWHREYERCVDEEDLEPYSFHPTNGELADSLVPQIRTEAYNLASADAEWQEAREDWWACLRDNGLTPRTEAGAWTSQQADDLWDQYHEGAIPPDKEEEIRVAVIEATCNLETGSSQRLGDLEAGYQQTLIDQNQAALNEIRSRNQERLRAAEDYVARHG